MDRYSREMRRGGADHRPPSDEQSIAAAPGAWTPFGRASVAALLAGVTVGAPGLGEASLSAMIICFAAVGFVIVESTRSTGGPRSEHARRPTVTPALLASVAVFLAAFAGSLAAAVTGSPHLSIAIAGLALVLLLPLIWLDERNR